jgi:hypothetical protein
MGTSMKQLTSRERPLVVRLALQTCKQYLLVRNIYYSSMIIKRVTRKIYIYTADENGEHIFTLIFAHMYIQVIINPLNNCVHKDHYLGRVGDNIWPRGLGGKKNCKYSRSSCVIIGTHFHHFKMFQIISCLDLV